MSIGGHGCKDALFVVQCYVGGSDRRLEIWHHYQKLGIKDLFLSLAAIPSLRLLFCLSALSPVEVECDVGIITVVQHTEFTVVQ